MKLQLFLQSMIIYNQINKYCHIQFMFHSAIKKMGLFRYNQQQTNFKDMLLRYNY